MARGNPLPREQMTAEIVRYWLDYDPETGAFTWRRPKPKVRVGMRAGTVQWGYVVIRLCGRDYAAHRLAWLHVHGEWPNGLVDHENREPLDNRLTNLRPANGTQNNANTALQRNNTSGFKGVSFHGSSGRWRAVIKKNGVARQIGSFESAAEAADAYDRAALSSFGAFARTNATIHGKAA